MRKRIKLLIFLALLFSYCIAIQDATQGKLKKKTQMYENTGIVWTPHWCVTECLPFHHFVFERKK